MDELAELLKRSVAEFKALSPEKKAKMYQAQRESFVRAMQPCEHGIYDFEDCQLCRDPAKGEASNA